MLSFFSRPGIGLELAPSALHIGIVASAKQALLAKAVPLPAGMIGDNYSLLPAAESGQLRDILRRELAAASPRAVRRAALALPDPLFRVQTLEFDELPSAAADRERLVRWRLEKTAAFDVARSAVRFQATRRADSGFSLFTCIANAELLGQYEELLISLGCEPWVIAPASLHAANFYYPYMAGRSPGRFAFAWIRESYFTMIFFERGGPRFHRSRELKSGPAGDAQQRLIRELDDSLHFYTHADRQQAVETVRLFVAGEVPSPEVLREGLCSTNTVEVEFLRPRAVLAGDAGADDGSLSAVFGAAGAAA